MPLHNCPACACHIMEGASACPHCGVPLSVKTPRLTGAAALMGLALTGLTACAQDMYGLAKVDPVDEDEDGYFIPGEDCDDSDPDVNPEAEEIPGDGVDSNCDGEDDT